MEATVMKNILLLVHDDAGQEARFQVALDVARAVEGHLTCLDVTVLPNFPYACPDGIDAGVLLQEERVREDANKLRVQADLANELVPWNWLDATGSIAPCVGDAAALADLIVVSRKLDDFPIPDMRAAASELLVRADRPILAVPDSARGLDLSGTALIAWDGSAAAAAALRAAVPLLHLAGTVIVYHVDEGTPPLLTDEAAVYLSRHGITATVEIEAADGATVGGMILDAVGRFGADYLVMGGFGHARWVEALFGGVTRRMLGHAPIPVLLAH
jgi:nucleotide-binding universal stress UspA family protein